MNFPFLKKKNYNTHTISDKELIIKNADPSLSEAFKATRTNLMYALTDTEGCKLLLVTSAFSAEGKTTTCINLATTLAQTDARVLLVDTDLRKPRVHAYLGVINEGGLTNYLGGFASIDSIIRRFEEYNFDFVTAGDIPPNPAEILSSKKFKQFVEEVKKRYDYIIFDTPPVNAVTDALSVVKEVKNVVFVCRLGVSVSTEIKKAISSLEFTQAKILGIITISSKDRRHEYFSAYSEYYYYYK